MQRFIEVAGSQGLQTHQAIPQEGQEAYLVVQKGEVLKPLSDFCFETLIHPATDFFPRGRNLGDAFASQKDGSLDQPAPVSIGKGFAGENEDVMKAVVPDEEHGGAFTRFFPDR